MHLAICIPKKSPFYVLSLYSKLHLICVANFYQFLEIIVTKYFLKGIFQKFGRGQGPYSHIHVVALPNRIRCPHTHEQISLRKESIDTL